MYQHEASRQSSILAQMGMMVIQVRDRSGTIWLCVLPRATHEKNETAKNFRASGYVVSSIQNSDPMMSDCAAVGPAAQSLSRSRQTDIYTPL